MKKLFSIVPFLLLSLLSSAQLLVNHGIASRSFNKNYPVVIDTFTGTDGVSITSRTTNSGESWTLGTSDILITSNAARASANATGAIAWIDKGWQNVVIKLDFSTTTGNDQVGVVLRYVDSNNYYRIVYENTGNPFRLYQVVAGVESLLQFKTQPTYLSTPAIEVQLTGNDLKAYSGDRIVNTTTLTNFTGATKHGIYVKKPSSGVSSNIDNFQMYNYTLVNVPNEVNKIVLRTPNAYQVLQRSGTTANINIQGDFLKDGVSHNIEASYNGGGFTTIATASTGTFNGTLTAQAQGQGNLIVRLVDQPSVSITVPYVGIGDVFVSAGQSNGSGLASSLQTYTHATLKAALYTNTYRYLYMTDPTDLIDGQIDVISNDQVNGGITPNGSYWPIVANQYMAARNIPIMIIPCTLGGSAISAWQKTSTSTDRTTLYGSMVYRALQQPNGICGVIFHQGESDATIASGPTSQASYEANLTAFVNNVYSDLGVPVMINKIHYWTAAPSTTVTNVTNLHSYIDNVIAAIPTKAKLGANFHLPTDITTALHFNTNAEILEAGTRVYTALNIVWP